MAADSFRVASDALRDAGGEVSELAHPFLHLLPVSGVSVSTFGPLLAAETISATDDRAVRVDELQFDLGEGPCWDALAARRPVLEPDFTAANQTWPAFSEAIRHEQISSVFAFPLVFGPLDLGAVDLYSLTPTRLSVEQQRQALELSAIVSRIVLRHAVGDAETHRGSPYSRRLIHQATGMVLAQLQTTADNAYLIIQARAYAESRPMRSVAEDIIGRRIRFTSLPDSEGQSG